MEPYIGLNIEGQRCVAGISDIVKPVLQTRFGYPDGNCLAAALASILEVELCVIPEFGIGDDWYVRFSEYMVSHYGLQPIDVYASDLPERFKPKGYHLINGRSPRGDMFHTMVGFCCNPIHDPHPKGNCQLLEIESYTLFVVVDPKGERNEM